MMVKLPAPAKLTVRLYALACMKYQIANAHKDDGEAARVHKRDNKPIHAAAGARGDI